MPEIKNTFQKGVMNKDLDERIIPIGQYRDAMNIQVSTSEDSEVGTAQNILGNTRVEGIVNVSNATCVGAVADEKNDVLYWFVTSPDVDAIIEYKDDGDVTPVLVDRNKDVLKFDPLNIITGINIIDNLLFWTDNVNEPKKINIDTFKLNPPTNGLNVHSDMYVNEASVGPVTEDHITVIRKRPNKAPDIKFIETATFPITDMPNLNFHGVGISSPIINYQLGDQNNPVSTPPFSPNDLILLSESTVSGSLPQNYQIKLQVTSSSPVLGTISGASAIVGVVYDFEIIEILNSFDDEEIDFQATLSVDVDPLFEKDFVRFATRYKYTDGEYSAFSPFTQPVFVTGRFGFHPTKDPYNLGMENQLLNVRLDNLIETKIPKDVVQLDILFKKERSTTIYSIDSIKIDDPLPSAWNNTSFTGNAVYSWDGTSFMSDTLPGTEHPTGQYDITVENIYAALPENQMLRPWDNVPRKALAQEITGNRVIYGNYLQNYTNIDDNGNLASPNIIVEKEERSFDINGTIGSFDSYGFKSIKSLRKYYLGVLYGDKYGRETPVFTNKEASINVPYQDIVNGQVVYNAAKSLRLKARLSGNTPSWAHYYKFYIKQTTGEYYNLTLDRVYKNQEDFNLWLSFPSSDRNKVQEGDYIILKKQVDVESVVPAEEKIKIIDIKNEAPESIKFNFMSLGTGGGTAADNTALFPDINQHPGEGVAKLLIDREAWIETEGGIDLVEGTTKSDKLAVQFTTNQGGNTIKSKKYFVAAWALEPGGNDDRYSLLLRQIIDPEDSWVESSPGVLNSDDSFSITIFKLDEKDATEFEGRFFMKVISNAVTQTYLIPSTSDTDVYRVLGKMNTFALADKYSSMGSAIQGIYNTQQTSWTQTSASGITDTPTKWAAATQFDTGTDNQGAFFIDNMYFVAAQEDTGTNIDAGKSGRMVKGNDLTSANPELEYINGLEGILQIDTTQGQPYGLNATTGAPQGIRHWSSTAIRMEDNVNTLQYKNGVANWDNTYNPIQDGHMMHLSFACPGEDLHDGTHNNTSSPSVYTNGSNGIGDILGSPGAGIFPGPWVESQKIYASQGHVAKDGFGNQGNVNSDFDKSGAFDTDSNGDWSGLSPEDQEISQNQFNPGWKNPYAQSVIDNLVQGNRFVIDGSDNTIYTILKINKKYLYNHTAWNLSPTWLGNGQTLRVYNHPILGSSVADFAYPSVCEAWANFTTNIYASGPTEFAAFKNTLENFGKANNRRVCYIMELDKDPTQQPGYAASLGTADRINPVQLRFVDNYLEEGSNTLPTSPAVFETEAKEDQDLNIYYEASDCLPISVENNAEDVRGHLLAPIGTKVLCSLSNSDPTDWDLINETAAQEVFLRVTGWSGNTLTISEPGLVYDSTAGSGLEATNYIGKFLRFVKEDGSYTQAKIKNITIPTSSKIIELEIQQATYKNYSGLPYYNCFSFGNGVESNRIRDDFNESFILNGVRASTTLEEPYEEERRKYGLIYSGLYNSTSGLNNLNQFIQAEKITKDLMPSYGSIQKLYARDKDLITLCEDKILQIFVDKDILYNADGNAQLLSTNKVLGEASPFRGNFGISKNPESFAAESFRAYFTDKQRGAVLRLSMDGLTPISDAGMHDYFRDTLKNKQALQGSYDSHKGNYNLSILALDDEDKITNGEFNVGTQNFTELSEELTNNSFDNQTTTTTTLPTWGFQTQSSQSGNYTGNSAIFFPVDLPAVLPSGVSPLVGQYVLAVDNDFDGTNEYTIGIVQAQVTAVNQTTGEITFNIVNTLVPQASTNLTDMYAGGFGGSAEFIFGDPVGTATVTTTDDWNGINSMNINNNNGTIELFDGDGFSQTSVILDSNKLYRVQVVVGSGSMWGPGSTNAPRLLIGTNNPQEFNAQPNPSGVSISGPGTITDDMTNLNNLSFNVTGGSLNIESISIKELMPQGGTALNWDLFEGASGTYTNTEDGELEFITDGLGRRISFNSTSTDLKRLSQIITNHTIEQGIKYRLNFNISNYQSGTLKPYLRANTSGEPGIDFNSVNSNGSFEFIDTFSYGNATLLGVFPQYENRLIFETQDFIGDIDNVSLYVHGYVGKTVTYNEKSKGWVSFKSFVPEFGLSSVNQYYTMSLGRLWKHHTNETRNTFYEDIGDDPGSGFTESSVRPILNMQPDLVKNFNTLKYEGSQSRVDQLQTHNLLPSQTVAIGPNLALINQVTGLVPVITNTQLNFTNINNGIIITDLQGGLQSGVALSDWSIINFDDVPSQDSSGAQITYRLSFDFNILDINPDSHFLITISGSSTSMQSSQLFSNGHFSNDFTATGSTTTNVSVVIRHPFMQDGYSDNVNVEITNLVVQRLEALDPNDGQYYNLQGEDGWYVYYIKTDKQEGTLNEFIEKEGKWFNYIKGNSREIDPTAFNFQGLGIVEAATAPQPSSLYLFGCGDPTATNYNPLADVFDNSMCVYNP